MEFLQRGEGAVLLGPAIGDSAQEWIRHAFLGENRVEVGARVQKWSEWVKARARDRVLGEGRGFRPLNGAGQRQHLREVARILSEAGAFYHLKEIWSEERFFAALLKCVDEARRAGLVDAESIARAKEMLEEGSDPVTREAYTDFWNLLEQYERVLTVQEEERLDTSLILRFAAEAQFGPESFFLLGFSQFSLLEVELLQRLARETEVVLPLPLARECIQAVLKNTDAPVEHTAALALRGLTTGFSGSTNVVGSSSVEARPRRRLLSAHSPADEARAAAALARATQDRFAEFRFILPDGYFREGGTAVAFREELGLPEHFELQTALAHPISRLFFHVLELKEKDFSLAYALEFAQLLSFTRSEFSEIASLASRAGVRKGLADWRRRAGSHPLFGQFVALLEEMSGLLPERGTASQFADATERLAKLAGIGELALRAPDHLTEREAHGALSGILRNAQMLKASVRGELSFSEWMKELKAALEAAQVSERPSFFPKVQFYRLQDWLPPAGEQCLTFVLGLHSGNEPGRTFNFFLEERARRKLSDFLLPTRVQEDLSFLDSLERAAAGGEVLFSFARHDSLGKELEPSWVAGPLGLIASAWPEIAPEETPRDWHVVESVHVPGIAFDHFSASLFETYKECPFKAFAERILRLKDKVQDSSLDVSRLAEGALVHKVLELYYGSENGKEIADPATREAALARCLEKARALPELRVEYFRGNETLLEAQFRRLLRTLVEFVHADAAHYAKFPFFNRPETEKNVEGMLGPFRWEGTIDRVDVDEEARKLLVVDYKVGATTPKSKEIDDLKRFQLQLYMDAAEAARPGFEAVGALYASVATGERSQGAVRKDLNAGPKGPKPGERKYFDFGGTSSALYTEEEFRDLRERTRSEAMRLAMNISEGNFSVTPLDEEESCPRCAMRPTCRIRELRAPPRESFPRLAPKELLPVLAEPEATEETSGAAKGFNPEQADALERRGTLVFIEASAGTGKTTVIAERIRAFLSERKKLEPAPQAVEKFAAISFTEKSAQELAARAAKLLLADPELGPQVAAQARQQISTIHGFCRRIINDFPVEAGVSPLAATLDQRGAEGLLYETIEEFFLFPDAQTNELLEAAFRNFARARLEEMLRRLLQERFLIQEEVAAFRSGAASAQIFPEGLAREALLGLLELADRLALLYEKKKGERNMLDFNDLEALTLKVLAHEHARAYYRDRYELLLVDEFQDTNAIQRTILDAVARPEGANLFVVGDAKQSIYRFRAADVSVFQRMRQQAAERGQLVTLSRNYRSAREIVEMANCVTKAIFPAAGAEAPDFEAMDAPAIAERAAGGKVALVEYGEAEEVPKLGEARAAEAIMVANLVREIRARKGPPVSIAILLRKIAGNENYLRALAEAGIPFRVGSSRGFYSQIVITDSIALLRVLFGAKNDVALLAVLRSPWIGLSDPHIWNIQKRAAPLVALGEKLREPDVPWLYAIRAFAAHASVSSILERAYRDYPMGRRELLQSRKLLAIVQGLESEGRPRAEILALLSDWAGWAKEDEALDDAPMPEPGGEGTVQVMTVHAAKGLEFDVTILADLAGKLKGDNSPLRIVRGAGMVLKLEQEEKSAPYTAIGKKSQERELAELKRLFYVALTRAKKEEYIFLPKAFAAAEPAKWGNCGHFLRAAELEGKVERIDGNERFGIPTRLQASEHQEASTTQWPAPPLFENFHGSSVTKLAAFEFCPEFHRRKVVQSWDDQVVALWQVAGEKRGIRTGGTQGKDQGKDYVARLLRKLKIENKERGVALHRVLERTKLGEFNSDQALLWLKEAYEAQGADIELEEFHELADHDLNLLQRFLDSPLGRELFSPDVEAHPELTFQWNVDRAHLQGSIDRVIRKTDGSWLVVDYKSSVLEESLDEYRFQVKAYMAAVSAYAKSKYGEAPKIEGFLVDLYSCKSVSVSEDPAEAMADLRKNLSAVRESYTQASNRTHFIRGGLIGGKHCLKCTYRFHCEIGQEIG